MSQKTIVIAAGAAALTVGLILGLATVPSARAA
jgi:hypothetical protein